MRGFFNQTGIFFRPNRCTFLSRAPIYTEIHKIFTHRVMQYAIPSKAYYDAKLAKYLHICAIFWQNFRERVFVFSILWRKSIPLLYIPMAISR